MAADNQPDPAVDLLAQLRGALEQLNAVAARVPGVAQATAHLPSIPAPARITAAQISAMVGAVRAQRASMQALRTSLDAGAVDLCYDVPKKPRLGERPTSCSRSSTPRRSGRPRPRSMIGTSWSRRTASTA